MKRARFPIVKRLSDFNYQFQPSVNRQQINDHNDQCAIIKLGNRP